MTYNSLAITIFDTMYPPKDQTCSAQILWFIVVVVPKTYCALRYLGYSNSARKLSFCTLTEFIFLYEVGITGDLSVSQVSCQVSYNKNWLSCKVSELHWQLLPGMSMCLVRQGSWTLPPARPHNKTRECQRKQFTWRFTWSCFSSYRKQY